MSQFGQTRTFADIRDTSAYPSTADLRQALCEVRYVPIADFYTAPLVHSERPPRGGLSEIRSSVLSREAFNVPAKDIEACLESLA
jgi:hypothetical protein